MEINEYPGSKAIFRKPAIVIAAFSLLITVIPANAVSGAGPPEFARVIVHLDPDGPGARGFADQIIGRFGGNSRFIYENAVNGFTAELPPAAITALSRNPNVLSITPDRVVVSIQAQEQPTGYDRIEADLSPATAPQASVCPSGEVCADVDVAILDTGTNDHPDLNIVARTDCSGIVLANSGSCVDGSGFDGHGHGTHVSGTVAAFDNGIGVVGIAPGAAIHSVKVLRDDGSGYLGALIAGVDWVTARAGVIDVVNMSLGGTFSDSMFDAAISNSVAAGVTYVVAAGNSGVDAATFSPANHPDVITVSAVADADGGSGGLSGFRCRNDVVDDTLASFSNYGQVVDIGAPGACILSTWRDGGYEVLSGTSMASPHVAGAAALYLAINGRDVNGDTQVDKSDVDVVKAALIGDGKAQGDVCGFSGDPDTFPEPLLFVNGSSFGGDGTCQQTPPDPTPPSAPGALTATPDGYPIELSWVAADDPESGILEYRVYRDTVPSSGQSQLIGTASYDATTYRDTTPEPAATYEYELTAVNLQFGEGPVSTAAQATNSSDDPTDAGWWAFDASSGDVALDSSAWRRDGSLVNGPLREPSGRFGGAIDLDGGDDRIDLDPAVLDGFGDASFAVWVKTTKTGQQALLSGANPGNDNEFLLFLPNDTTLRFYTGTTASGGVEWSMDSVADGQWHHLTVVRNEILEQVTAYRNGVSLGTWGLSQPMDVLDIDALVIGQEQDSVGGGFSTAQAFDGQMDEAKVFTRLLTQGEIDVLSDRDTTPPEPPGNLMAVSVGSGIDLGWDPSEDPESGIAEYQVWRDAGAGGAKSLLTTLPAVQTTYRDMTVRPGLTYAYEVIAVNGADLAGPSSGEETATAGAAPATLLGWWALDDGSGTSAADWSPPGRAGSLGDDPTWTGGHFGGGLDFDGVGDLVDLDSTVLDGEDDVTMTLWFKTTKTGIQALVSGANAGNDAEYELVLLSNPDLRLRFYIGELSTNFVFWPLPTAADGNWHHLAVVRDGGNDLAILYFDGVSQGSRSAVFEPLSIDSGGFVLGQEQDTVGGGFDATQAFVGSMDDVRVYNTLLTESEIHDIAGMGQPTLDVTSPDPPTGLVATPADAEVVLDWDDHPEPAVTFSVHRSETSGGPYGLLASGLISSELTDNSALNGTTYYYVVTASDTAGNESGYSSEASATPTAPNSPPVAVDDSYVTGEDTQLAVAVPGVLGNDSDADGDSLTAAVATGPASGALSLAADGSFTYTPDPDFNGTDSFTYTASDGTDSSASATVTITVNPVNDAPVAVITGPADSSVFTQGDPVTFAGTATDVEDGDLTTALAWTSDLDGGIGTGAGFTISTLSVGTHTITATVTDSGGLAGDDTISITVDPAPSSGGPYLEQGVVVGVASDGWTTVNLTSGHTYESMVVVATPVYTSGSDPVVTRVRNAAGTSFEVKLDRTTGGATVVADVHWMVVEEGVYSQADHGVDMEAHKYTSTVTDHKGSWSGEARTYSNTYTNPVVVGQVMTENDDAWSVFWARGSSRSNPPAGTLHVGKHVGEDPNNTRANETVGYIVVEAGTGVIDGTSFTAALGSDTIRGVGNSPPYSYTYTGNGASAVASLAGMDGNDGGWAILYGNPLTGSQINLAIDEDQAGGSERSHTSEQVAHIIFHD